jgi:hypothetical protein
VPTQIVRFLLKKEAMTGFACSDFEPIAFYYLAICYFVFVGRLFVIDLYMLSSMLLSNLAFMISKVPRILETFWSPTDNAAHVLLGHTEGDRRGD